MAAFWAVLALLAWGCLRADGLVGNIRIWLSDTDPWVEPFPLLGKLDRSMAISLALVVAMGIALHRMLNRPRVADILIDTESELRKVTWPTFGDTWKGALAVVVTVAFLLVYLTGADLVIHFLMNNVMRAG